MIMGGYYIEPNDTGFLYFRIRRIRLRKGEDCLMPTKKLLNALSMHYELDSADMSPDLQIPFDMRSVIPAICGHSFFKYFYGCKVNVLIRHLGQ